MLRSIMLLLSALPAAAYADVTATYETGRGIAMMVIEAADNGAVRTTHKAAMAGSQELLAFMTPEGREYMAWKVDDAWFVADYEDVLAVILEGVATRRTGEEPGRSPAWPKKNLVEQGVETVAGRTGKRFVVRNEDGSLVPNLDLVVSADADLAPVGRFLGRTFLSSLMGMSNLIGDMPPEFEQMTELMSRGTMIRMGRMTALKSVKAGAIDPARFALPAPPASREAVRRAMTHQRPDQPAPEKVD